MQLTSWSDLELLGFDGFATVEALKHRDVIPQSPGVYCVVWSGPRQPVFVEVGTGGRFKGKDPNVAISKLYENWVTGSAILYIGKASGGKSGKRGLRKRLSEYLEFGEGRPIGHSGGRYIWQIKDSRSLLICWKITDIEPRRVEKSMIFDFKAQFGQRPFANLQD